MHIKKVKRKKKTANTRTKTGLSMAEEAPEETVSCPSPMIPRALRYFLLYVVVLVSFINLFEQRKIWLLIFSFLFEGNLLLKCKHVYYI